MLNPDGEAILAALAAAGVPAALVTHDAVVAANSLAGRLGDGAAILALARRSEASTVQAGDRTFEVRAVDAGDLRLVLGQDVTAADQAQRMVSASDEFLSFASHELKGPLHVLGLASHLIEARTGRGDSVEPSTIEQVRRQITRLTRLINQLLDVTRVRQSRIELMLEPLDVGVLVDAAIQQAELGAIAATVKRAAGDATVRCDRVRCTEILVELLENAARHAPPSTALEVEIEHGPSDVTVTVSDQGPGVATALRPTLFEVAPGGRGGARKSPRQGLGMGLHIARSLAHLHGGDLTLDERATGGRFVLRLPRAAA